MTTPTYGMIFNETETAPYAVVSGDSSIIGLVLCQDDANALAFPLGVATMFNSSDPNYIVSNVAGTPPKIGATGDLAKAVASINKQLAQFESAATIIVVPVTRVTTGSGSAPLVATIANIVAALPVLQQAGPMLGYIPRLIGCPGYTGYQAPNPTDGQPALTNAVCAALPAVLQALNAVAFVSDAGDGVLANSVAWRQTLASDRLIPCDAYVVDPTGAIITDGVAEALGLQVAVDFQHQGLPGWSISGHQVQGIGGLKNYYAFSLTDGACHGQQLLANQIATIEAGVIGSDTAVASSGFVWTGVWNASEDSNKWFYNKRRMKDWCYLQLIKAIRLRLGVENTTPQGVMDVLNDMKQVGSYLLSRQISIGFKVSFVGSQTSASDLQQGRFTVGFANEIPAPITLITVLASDYYQALVVEEQTIISEASGITPEYISASSSPSTGD
jgi:phage tail sheath protein FI